MAEAIVSAVVQSIGELLVDQTISFITSFTRVHEQFERLQKELISIQGFLSTADSIRSQDPGIRIWVSDVREIAYDVDDVIIAFLRKVAHKEEGESSFKRYADKPKKVLNCYKVNKKMEKIFLKLKHIAERRKRYTGITTEKTVPSTSTNTNNMLLRRVYSHTKDDVIIGLEEQTNALVSKLLKEEDPRCVVSIYGLGGLGKTTLAKEVYNHRKIKSHFDCYAWTSISQQLSTGVVLKEILRKVSTLTSNDMGEMNEVELMGKLFAILEGKRYLVVLDDIWRERDWNILKPAFPCNKGSKVMLTTRNLEVAKHADPLGCHFEPRSLTDEEAWELLRTKAFPRNVSSSNLSLSRDIEECGREIVKKCCGLPLAIICLGGILQLKRSLNEWESVYQKIGIDLRSDKDDRLFSILSLSYFELPYHLKPLFLYLGLFPEDSIIPVNKLVCMWMAESLIKEQKGKTIEEVGRQYLDELIHRCMVQICEKNLLGKVKTCRLHDKMRDVCITIGMQEEFFEVISTTQHSNCSSSSSSCFVPSSTKLRRCAIYVGEDMQYVFPKHLIPCLHTAFFILKAPITNFPSIVYKNFKFLKVLEFQGRRIVSSKKELGRELGKLSNLRYLCLRGFVLGPNIIKYLGNLVCLQTLDLRGTLPYNMSDLIFEMRQLRNLYGSNIQLLRINTLTELRTLSVMQAGQWITDLIKLTNLDKLGITELEEKTVELLLNAVVGGLDKLRSLYIHAIHEADFSELLEGLSGKCRLLKLKLWGRISKLPCQLPSNLTKLNIGIAYLSKDPMPTLERLQHLVYLGLSYKSYEGKAMVCSGQGFPQLRYLKIMFLDQLEEWTVEKGAMPCLATCVILSCDKLKMVPQGFKFISTLQELEILAMPLIFEERVKEGGEDWRTVQHIPSIFTYHRER